WTSSARFGGSPCRSLTPESWRHTPIISGRQPGATRVHRGSLDAAVERRDRDAGTGAERVVVGMDRRVGRGQWWTPGRVPPRGAAREWQITLASRHVGIVVIGLEHVVGGKRVIPAKEVIDGPVRPQRQGGAGIPEAVAVGIAVGEAPAIARPG